MKGNDFPKQNVTLYHKDNYGNYARYPLIASFRNTTSLKRDTTGVDDTIDEVLVRIFTSDHRLDTYEIAKEDILVNKKVEDTVEIAPYTELSKKYGRNNVFQVTSIDKFIFGTELDHIKIGAK